MVIAHALFGAFCYQLPGWPVWVGVIYSQPALLAVWAGLADNAPGPFRFAMSLILLSVVTLATTWSGYLENYFARVSAYDIIAGVISLTQFLCLLISILVIRVVANRLLTAPEAHGIQSNRKNLSLLHLVWLTSASALAFGLWAMLLRNAELSEPHLFDRQYMVDQIRLGTIYGGLTLPIVLSVCLVFCESKRIGILILIAFVLVLEIPFASALRWLDPTRVFDVESLWSTTKMLVSFHLSVFLTLVALRFSGVRMSFR